MMINVHFLKIMGKIKLKISTIYTSLVGALSVTVIHVKNRIGGPEEKNLIMLFGFPFGKAKTYLFSS